MKWHGLTANLMSLSGLAIGIGMMADGAVAMVRTSTGISPNRPAN